MSQNKNFKNKNFKNKNFKNKNNILLDANNNKTASGFIVISISNLILKYTFLIHFLILFFNLIFEKFTLFNHFNLICLSQIGFINFVYLEFYFLFYFLILAVLRFLFHDYIKVKKNDSTEKNDSTDDIVYFFIFLNFIFCIVDIDLLGYNLNLFYCCHPPIVFLGLNFSSHIDLISMINTLYHQEVYDNSFNIKFVLFHYKLSYQTANWIYVVHEFFKKYLGVDWSYFFSKAQKINFYLFKESLPYCLNLIYFIKFIIFLFKFLYKIRKYINKFMKKFK